MAIYSVGNVFELIAGSGPCVAVAFGNYDGGFATFSTEWRGFQQEFDPGEGGDAYDPLENGAIPVGNGRWLFAIPTPIGDGITDVEIEAALQTGVDWAVQKNIKLIITNGASPPNKVRNEATVANRANWIVDFARNREEESGIRFHLINRSTVFVNRLVDDHQ